MNAHIATLQLLLELGNPPDSYQLPSSLREIAQKFDITNYEKLYDSFWQEVQNSSPAADGLSGFSFLTRTYFGFCILSSVDLSDQLEVLEQKIHSPRAELDVELWEGLMHILRAISGRIRRRITLEAFEDAVGEVNWGGLAADSAWMSAVSGLIGLTYLREERDQAGKAPVWLDQAVKTGSEVQTLVVRYARQRYALDREPLRENVASYTEDLRVEASSPGLKRAYRLAELELKARIMYHELDSYNGETYADAVQNIIRLDQECRDLGEMSSCSVVVFEALLGKLYTRVSTIPQENNEVEAQLTRSTQYFERALAVAEPLHSQAILAGLKAERITAMLQAGIQVSEKEAREPVSAFKKQQLLPEYVEQLQQQARLFSSLSQWSKLSDLITEILKYASKQQDAARYYLMLSGFRIGNRFMNEELDKPGVSWIVEKLSDYFGYYESTIQELLEMDTFDPIGSQMFEEFRRLFKELGTLIHSNIHVYYRYQYQTVNILTLSLKKQGDQYGQEIGQQLTSLFDHPNNPMNIIKADWEDFKDVPNSVRNRTLNKCIDISKGDLPLAAEQLDFSYRNLRSYITFKEVNRLGFFLDQSTTSNKQLEQGIRFMFHDLYKKGTIFEVVFDMPKFLVDHVNSGFYSQDLEEALDIKGTTAKKYIKIMASIGMIYQEKIPGRKHFYRVKKDEIMKRLGADQATLIES